MQGYLFFQPQSSLKSSLLRSTFIFHSSRKDMFDKKKKTNEAPNEQQRHSSESSRPLLMRTSLQQSTVGDGASATDDIDSSPAMETDDFKTPSSTKSQEEEHPGASSSGHGPLAYGSYPPLWSPTPKPSSRPKAQPAAEQQYTSVERMKAILNTGSPSSSKEPERRFEEQDPGNHHLYLHGRDRRWNDTHGRLNFYGVDVLTERQKKKKLN